MEVTAQDQENICSFSVLADQLREIKQEIKDLEEKKVLLGDVQDELMLAEPEEDGEGGGGSYFKMGDCFIKMNEDRFNSALDLELKNTVSKLESKSAEVKDLYVRMNLLKSELYSKFKDQIALEFD